MIPSAAGVYNVTVFFRGGEFQTLENVRMYEGDWCVQLVTDKETLVINKDEILFMRAEKIDE